MAKRNRPPKHKRSKGEHPHPNYNPDKRPTRPLTKRRSTYRKVQ